MKTPALVSLVVLGSLVCACGGGGGGGLDPVFAVPLLDKPFGLAVFSGHVIDHPKFPLVPGTRTIFESATAGGLERVVVEVTRSTKVIVGVTCVEVHDTGFLNGSLTEDTLDWYAQDGAGNVWYFGEDSTKFLNGVIIGTEGSWRAGVGGAVAGIVMLAAPAVGQAYAQEDAPGAAQDRAYVVSLADSVTVPVATYTGCLHTRDFTPIDPDNIEEKFYATGVGVVLELDADGARLQLIAIEHF